MKIIVTHHQITVGLGAGLMAPVALGEGVDCDCHRRHHDYHHHHPYHRNHNLIIIIISGEGEEWRILEGDNAPDGWKVSLDP